MRSFSRAGSVAMASVVLVSIGIGLGVYVLADTGSGPSDETVTISEPVAFDGEVPAVNGNELTATAGRSFRRAAVELAGEIVTPQVVVDVFYFTDSVEELKP